MTTIKTSHRTKWISILAVCLFLLTFATPAFAGGGNVQPPTAHPKGYSLADAAAATAYFNTGPRTPDTLPEGFPFQILYVDVNGEPETFHVRPGTMLYVPVVYSDDTDGLNWPFPDVNDPQAVSDYYFDPAQLGAETLTIAVDGNVTSLGPRYAVGAETPGLPSGGNNYTVVAAFLTPLTKGTHTVSIDVYLDGAFIGGVFAFTAEYTVIVG